MTNVIPCVPSISIPFSTNIYLKESHLGDIVFLLEFYFFFFQHLLHYDARACDRFLKGRLGSSFIVMVLL